MLFWFLLTPVAHSETQGLEEETFKPLILQWQVSHFRNTDQISLIFRQNTVELVTNTSSYQTGEKARLGRFKSPMNPELKGLEEQIKSYYDRLRKTVPMSTLITDPRFHPIVEPHAAILRVNEEEMQRGHPYFQTLVNIIYAVWEQEWICVECAIYEKTGNFIKRTVKKIKPTTKRGTASQKNSQDQIQDQWEIKEQKFTKKQLDCLSKSNDKIECIDLFGIFEI